jgi:V8-like Glu-specific endopeptidase
VRISYAAVLGPTLLLLSFVAAQNQRRIGTRHDVSLELHRQMGSNLGSFSSGENFPDLSPVGLVQSVEGSIGTGTLISPTIVVTAGHVLRGSYKEKAPVASEWTFSLGSDSLKPTWTYSVSEVILHPGWTARLSYEGGIGDGDALGLDLALLRLDLPVTGVTPARINVGNAERIGSRVILAGYGSIADGNRGVTSVDNFDRLAGENTLDRVVETVNASNVPQAYRGGLLGLDFDSPDEFLNSLGSNASLIDYLGSGSSASTPLPYEATTAEGDSGGPAFVKINDLWKVIGTVSYGTESSGYGDVTVYTRLASHSDWFRKYLERWAPARRTGFGEWLNLDWWGNFSTYQGDWVYHEKLGWFYSPGNEADEFWAWQTGIGWWWTSIKAYPYFYADERKCWLYFSASDSTPSRCRFYDYEVKEWLNL